MQDTELFIELAGIAGVFVGFGALIAVRSGGPSEPQEVAPMRAIVSLGLVAGVAALNVVTLGRYGATDHQVWALSSVLVFVGLIGMLAVNVRAPEYRASWETTHRSGWSVVVEGAAWVVYMSSLVVLLLLGAGWTLLRLVFARRRPAST
jgi:hypothetical protein